MKTKKTVAKTPQTTRMIIISKTKILMSYNIKSVGVPDDFHLLAEQFLRGLEVEHCSTLEKSSVAAFDAAATSNPMPAYTSGETESTPVHSTEFETCFPPMDEKHDEQKYKPKNKMLMLRRCCIL